jgi:hypothetical protein
MSEFERLLCMQKIIYKEQKEKRWEEYLQFLLGNRRKVNPSSAQKIQIMQNPYKSYFISLHNEKKWKTERTYTENVKSWY